MEAPSQILHVYKSSAGSGKTTALSIEYLKLALGGRDTFKHILALTFTNKAAQEMKDRILDYLQELASLDTNNPPFFFHELIPDIPKYKNYLAKKGEAEVARLIKDEAGLLYRKLLHQYSEYAVTTLDSFTNRLIRSFSHDLGLSFNYQVELETTQLLKDAVEELVNRVGVKEDMLTKVLTRYSRQKIDNESSRKINADLEARAKSLLNDVEEQHLKPLRKLSIQTILDVQKRLNFEIIKFEKQLQNYGQEFIEICAQKGIEEKMFNNGKTSIYPYFNRFKLKDFSKIPVNKNVLKIIETGNWTAKSAPLENKQLIESVADSLLSIYHSSQKHIEKENSNYLLMLQMKRGIFPYMVLMEMEKILSQIKEENQLLHISDFNKIISEEIAQESAPYIFERIGNKYQHFLLDEFQDTSVIQWHNLLPLIENSLSENNENLIVGDSKQAIYRWRGSKIEQFAQLPKLIGADKDALLKQRENMLKNAYLEVQLNTNYRSANTIIEFNNSLFQYIKDQQLLNEELSSIYDNHKQKVKDVNKNGGVVDIHIMELPKGSNKDIFTQAYQKRTLEIIRDCKTNDFDYKDIAVLARNNTDLILLAQFLLENKIPIVSSESLHVDSSPKVQFVLSIIKHIEQPNEKVFQAEIIKFLLDLGFIDSEDIQYLSKHLLSLDTHDELQKYWTALNMEFSKSELLSLEAYEAIEAIIRIFKLDKSEPLLHFFVEAAYMFTHEKHQGLKDFLLWWNIKHQEFKLEVPDDWDAVKLMSFHKAKGLEFPVVINWFSQKLNPSKAGKNTVWINPKMNKFPEIKSFPFSLSALEGTAHQSIYNQEMLLNILDDINLFYVANTRPTEKLFILVDNQLSNSSTAKGFPFSNIMNGFISFSEMKEIKENVYQMGSENSQIKQKSSFKLDADNSVHLKNVESDNWRKNLALSVDQGLANPWNSSAAWGQKVHTVLAEINSEKDLSSAFKRLIYKGIIDLDEQEVLQELVLQVLNHTQLKEFYKNEAMIFNERELYAPHESNSGEQEIFRPDRMVMLNGEVLIIDYKTGQANEKDQKQVQNYMALVAQITKKTTKGYLVYLHEDIIVNEVLSK